jgi:aminomethyltransferase
MVPFAGYEMPVQFRGVIPEHLKVREQVGLFDVSHMGKIEVVGPRARDFVSYITSNDVLKLEEGGVQYSLFLLPSGGIIDETLVYRLGDRFMLVANAVNTEKNYEWILEQKWDSVEVFDRTEELSILAVQGPLSEAAMIPHCGTSVHDLRYYRSTQVEMAGERCLISRTGYTGEDGFEIFVENGKAVEIWEMILRGGQPHGIEAIGLGARDTLRLEMKYCLYGSDVDEMTTPLEAGLGWIVGWNKSDFIGRDVLLRQRAEGIGRKLVGFELDAGIPRPGYEIHSDSRRVGTVTSGTYSPSLRRGIGMGYVKLPYAGNGTELWIETRSRREKATVVKTPFYKNYSHK